METKNHGKRNDDEKIHKYIWNDSSPRKDIRKIVMVSKHRMKSNLTDSDDDFFIVFGGVESYVCKLDP